MIHKLKTWPEYFHQVFMGYKIFEVRKNDRDFKVGDWLQLEEFDPKTEKYTGRNVSRRITYILKSSKDFGIIDGFVVMAIQ